MTSLINALDQYSNNNTQLGEKSHLEYSWSNNIRENIVQFHYQVTRTNKDGINNLEKKLDKILHELTTSSFSFIFNEERNELITTLFKLIGHTRDIVSGKGEYAITYMMLKVWYKYFPEAAKYALKLITDFDNSEEHPYGSWKDIKYFCNYLHVDCGFEENVPFILYACTLLNDSVRSSCMGKNISLAAKWVPREKSNKFGWLFNILAYEYFKCYLDSAKTELALLKAKTKAKMDYRRLISSLNRKLDTVQIKQCANTWSIIDHSKTTSITIAKQKNAFLNKKKDGSIKSERIDRIQCAENFKEYINNCIKNNCEIKGKRVGLQDFTKQALSLIGNNDDTNYHIEKDLLNSQWRDNCKQQNATSLGPMIAMVDTSGSMNGDPLYCAIALGCRVAEKSILGKRIMTFSAYPTWVNLEQCDNFVDMVKMIKDANWGMNTNFYAALKMILDAIVENKMEPECVENMVLAIFSDMQMDCACESNYSTLFANIERLYNETGIRVHGKPYKPPHILFWNLRSTNGFPTLSTQKGASMMSGFSPSLLDLFCEKGMDALHSCTPWNLFMQVLDNKRYKKLEDFIIQHISS